MSEKKTDLPKHRELSIPYGSAGPNSSSDNSGDQSNSGGQSDNLDNGSQQDSGDDKE